MNGSPLSPLRLALRAPLALPGVTLAAAGLIVALLWAGLLWQLGAGRAAIIAAERAKAEVLVGVIEQHVARTLRAAELTLREVEALYQQHGADFDLAAYAGDRRALLDPYHSLGVVDPWGDLIVTTTPPTPQPLNFSQSEAFRTLRGAAPPALYIGQPRRGVVTGRWSLFLARRMSTGDGAFGGFTTLALDPEYFSRIYRELAPASASVVALIGRDGVVRAGDDDGPLRAGADVSATELFTRHLARAARGSTVSATALADGIARIYGYAPVPGYRLSVVLGVSEGSVLSSHHSRLLVAVTMMGVITVIVAALGALAAVHMARQVQVSGQLARNEAALRASEERFALAVRGSNDGIWDWSVPTGDEYFSDRWCELVGYSREELRPDVESWISLLHPADRDATLAAVDRHLRERAPYDVEFRLRTKAGEYRWFRARGQAVWDEAGRPTRMAGSLTDVTETRRAIEAQQASEARLKEAQHLARIGNWELDLVTDTLTWSDEIFRIFEMDPARFGASSEAFLQAVHPDDREMVSATYRASVVNKTSYGVVHRLQMADGRIKWVEERGQTRYGDDGRPLRSLGVVQDITEREAASQELEVERNFSAAVFDFTPALIIVFDRHGRIVRYNDAAAAVSGYDKTELIGRLAWDVLLALPEERREVAERFAALSTMTCAEARARFGSTSQRTWRARGGAVRRITWSLAYLPDDQGKVAYSVASGLDVTEREQVEQALRASERKYRQLHESMTDAFVRVAMTGEILECNRAYEEMLGYTREELSRLTYVDLTPEQWRDAEMRLVAEEVLTRGYSGVYEKEYARKNREIFPVELRTFLLRDEAGVPSGMWAIVRDITARKRTEAELRRSLAEKEVLLQEVHHRVKNNLAVVAELLNLQALGSTDGALRTALRESQNRIQSMALIHETLYHSRELSAIPLGTYTERLCRQLFESYSVHAGHVRLSVIADPVELDLGRAVPFSLILNELVSNALKHAFPAGRPGSVEVRVTAEPPGALTLTVRDDGVGLDPAITAETASTLGMRLIRALAAQIRAALEIERRDGTIVRVILPGVNPSPPVS